MALGRTHDLFNLLLLPPCLYFTPKEFYLPFTLGYLVGTFLLSPDIDMKGSKPSKRWKILRFIWHPYQSRAKHRGVSHIPILGTFVRLVYLNLVVFFAYLILVYALKSYFPEYQDYVERFNPLIYLQQFAKSEASFYFILGLILSEVFHVFLDLVSSYPFRRGR